MRSPVSRQGGSLKRLLFLCADNHLASRYCEELFNSRIRDEGLNWQGISRAFAPVLASRSDEAMATEAVAGLRRRGAAPVNHRRLPLAALPFDFETSQHAIAILPPDQELALFRSWPTEADRIEPWPVSGPSVPALLDELTQSVDALVERLLDAAAAALSPRADRDRRTISAKLNLERDTAFGSGNGRFDAINPVNP